MNVEERKAAAEAWAKAVKPTGQHLMVQVGGAPLPDVLELVCFFFKKCIQIPSDKSTKIFESIIECCCISFF